MIMALYNKASETQLEYAMMSCSLN